MHGARWIGFLALALGISLMGCAYSEEIDGAPSDEIAAPTSAALELEFEDGEGGGFQPADGRERRRCRVVLNYCDRPGDDDRAECTIYDCEFWRGVAACATLANDVCGTAMLPYIN